MTHRFPTRMLLLLLVANLLTLLGRAASVGPAGYATDFGVLPSAADWATRNIPGAGGDAYDMDIDVTTNLNYSVASITFGTVSNATVPAAALTNATWSPSGTYVQTRPSSGRATVLLGKFTNDTGSNATAVAIAYQLTMAGALAVEDAGKGTHVYYSLNGLVGSWIPLPTLNNSSNTGTYALSTNLTVTWPAASPLYLLWVDDNTAAGTDAGNQIDNFSLGVSAGAALALEATLVTPAANAVLLSSSAVDVTATVVNGSGPYSVSYFTNSGAANPVFALAGMSTTPPYSLSLGSLPAGTYNIHAVATDSAAEPVSVFTATNSFQVVDPLAITLVAPVHDASVDYTVNVLGSTTVGGGTEPYSVQFFLDGTPSGPPVTSPPYQRDFGTLGIGDHIIRAAVTDGRGWVSNSLAHTVHITGPLAVTLESVNGSSMTLGQSLVLTAALLGGTSPYTVTFYTNGQPVGSLGATYSTNLGPVAVGSYTCVVEAVDSALPAAAVVYATNIVTVSPPPLLASLTAPAAGQIVLEGQSLNLTATASVAAPLSVSQVEFFLDGASAGVDSTAAYSVSVTPAVGAHTAYAVATDSLGRQVFTATNAFTVIVPVNAAVVGPTGYTNDFSTHPPVTDWATLSVAGGSTDTYTMDAHINGALSRNNATNRTTSAPNDPPAAAAAAVWSSASFYLQTRPTGNRYSTLMGRFLNQTGTNATAVRIAYQFTIAAGGIAEDVGTRAYYSLSGATGTWINLPTFSTLSSENGTTLLSTNLPIEWTNGGSLYLLWGDDNAAGQGTDGANQFDNFSLTVTAGELPPFIARLAAPANNALFVSGTTLTATVLLASGVSPYTVEFFTNSGLGNTVFSSAGVVPGTLAGSPYTLALGALPAGDYNLYAVATDSALSSTNSATNSFRVANPIAVALTAPVDNLTVDNLTPITGTATVAGGTPPYSVQFFLDNNPSGPAVVSEPFERGYGALLAGSHTIRATVTDARGWVSNSAISTVHVTGPLGAAVVPIDGASFLYGTSISLTGTLGGGSAPYTADFFLNGLPAGSVAVAPFVVNLGVLPEGFYTTHVHATDSSAPTPQQYDSATNGFTILPNPLLAAMTTPTNGAGGVAGVPFALTATASVNPPLTVTNVEFYYDNSLIGADATAPYVATMGSPAAGAHDFVAVAIDSLGRRGTSAVVTVTFIVDPLVNNNFDAAIVLGTPAMVTGNNTGANTQGGEPVNQFGGGQFLQWGATLWYRWTAPFGGTVTIDTLGSAIDTMLSVYTGSAVNSLTLVQRNNNVDGTTTASRVAFAATAGTEYQIQLGGQGGGFGGGQPAQGAFQLKLTMPPGVAITNPAPNAGFLVGEPIPVDVTASSPAGAVTNVSLYRGATLLGSLGASPYSFVVSNAPVGSNALYAVAIDSIGQVGTSAVVRVFVANVGLTITTPVEDQIFTGTNPITASVFTALPAGSITNVDFFIDGVLFGQDAVAPFSAVWNTPSGGSHRLTATGRDDAGNTYAATAVNFGVASGIVRSNSLWKYLADGSDQGTNWIAPGFDDSGWSNGLAELGYGDADEATVVPSGPDGAFYITTYFRRAFVATNVAGFTNLLLSLEYDDGGVVYLNGREVLRINLPAAPTVITAATTALNTGEDTLITVGINPTNLVEGVNVLAVEIHQQAANSSDISFNLDLQGIPVVVKNVSPEVAITAPTNSQYFIAPPAVTLSATASDSDGTISKVEFLANGVKIGEAFAGNPYEFTWTTPPIGAHTLTAVATDNQGATTISASISVVVYDASGTPVGAVTSPSNGAVMEGPTNLLITATANAILGVTNVQFLANGVPFGNDATAPYSAVWPSSFLSNGLQVLVTDANGVSGISPVTSVFITIPPTNVIAPTIATQLPAPYTTVTNLTNITVVFSERVQNVDAADLLVNGQPATSVVAAPNGSNYTFHFPHPSYGVVDFAFASGHGITDFGFPDVLPFNEFGDGASWSLQLNDQTPPMVAARTPSTGVTVTNLTEVSVTFSEGVSGVDAADLLVNGVPAFDFSGSGSNYLFQVAQPSSGTITISWATNHGIFDFADIPNSFNRTAAGNSWTFTLDSRTTFIHSNSTWRFIKGLAEASDPTNAWRQLGFDDSGWSNAAAPFFYGDPYTNFPAGIIGTELTDMRSNYSSIFLRREFVVQNRSVITNLLINAQSDDGYIAWLNGVEVRRFNAPAGQPSYSSVASGTATEQNNTATYIVATLTNNAVGALVNGTNILAIQAFNDNLTNSSDFGFNVQLYSFLPDTTVTPPRLAFATPAPGDLFYFTNVVITFSEDVTNVHAGDLLVNGVPATGLTVISNSTYSFDFPQPAYGAVALTWAAGHGIVDLDPVPKPFDGNAASAQLHYLLVNPSAPIVSVRVPAASTTLTGLVSITVVFSENVSGVDASDLLVNGVPATSVVQDSASEYFFFFPQPAFGQVTVRFATNNGISDMELPASAFDYTRPANQWSYTLIDPVPAVTMTAPTNGTYVLASANVTLRATATDNDGTVALVEFYDVQEGAKIGETAISPYSLTWSNLSVGTYILRAVATDNSGLQGTSAPVTVNVVTQLPIVLLRGPYLLAGSPTGGVVRWRTDQFSDGVVRYGTDLNNLTNVAVETTLTNNHVVRVGGLAPDTKYFYTIGSSSHTLGGGTLPGGSDYWFITSPEPGTPKPTRIWVLGDPGTATANQRAVRDAYYNYVNLTRPADLWLMLGDNAYNSGTDAEHQAAVFDMYPSTLRNYWLWPVLGNHETAQSTTATQFPYLDIFNTPRAGEAGGVPSGSGKYYSFDYGNIHFVGLDSMTSTYATNSVMANWLRDDLAANTQAWTIVYFHHPPYTKGSHNSDTESDLVALRQNLVPILEFYGVDLVLSGHSHCFERSYLLNGHYGLSTTLTPSMKIDGGDGREDGTGAYRKSESGEGVVYTVTGSAGQATGGTLNHPAHFNSLNQLGSTIIDVSSNRLDAIFLTSTGLTNDHYTLLKRQASPPLAPTNVLAHAIGTNAIQITWSDVATNEFGYYIDRSLDGTNFVRIGTNGFNTVAYLDSGLTPGLTYFYRVIAYNGAGESGGSGSSALTGNNPPALAAIGNVIADVLGSVFFVADGSDSDLPANALTYTLDAGAPATARVHATNGTFFWRPARTDVASTNPITVRVTDDGAPPLSATRSFTVVVRDYVEVSIGSTVLRAGSASNVIIELVATAPVNNVAFNVLLATDRLTTLTLDNLVPALATVSYSNAFAGALGVRFAALPGQVLSGTQQIARLNFTAAAGQTSAFVPLQFNNVSGTRAQPGLAPTMLANDGRVVVVGEQPLVEASLVGGVRTLSLYGKPGTNYMIETTATPAIPASWTPWRSLLLSELLGTTPADAGGPAIFYRAKE